MHPARRPCSHGRSAAQPVQRDWPVEAELLTGLTYGGLLRRLVDLTAPCHALPDVHVLASQQHSEFDLVADSAEGNDKDLKRGSGHRHSLTSRGSQGWLDKAAKVSTIALRSASWATRACNSSRA